MKFIIELVAITGDSDRYNIAGYLTADKGEEVLMSRMIECLNEVLENDAINFKDRIVVKEDKIIYNNIPVVACSNIMKVFNANLGVKVTTELAQHVKYVPKDCSKLFKMEMLRLFS